VQTPGPSFQRLSGWPRRLSGRGRRPWREMAHSAFMGEAEVHGALRAGVTRRAAGCPDLPGRGPRHGSRDLGPATTSLVTTVARATTTAPPPRQGPRVACRHRLFPGIGVIVAVDEGPETAPVGDQLPARLRLQGPPATRATVARAPGNTRSVAAFAGGGTERAVPVRYGAAPHVSDARCTGRAPPCRRERWRPAGRGCCARR
jgi:hypothetical protein